MIVSGCFSCDKGVGGIYVLFIGLNGKGSGSQTLRQAQLQAENR